MPPQADEPRRVDPPGLAAIRLVFGVGRGPEQEPTAESFTPVYTVGIPVFSLGGLDPDGVYEFDAGAQLELLRERAKQRRWAVRLELDFVQSAESVSAADLWVEVDWSTDDAREPSSAPELVVLGPERGSTTPGGGRSLTIASTPLTEVAAARRLGGRFTVQLRDADPRTSAPVSVESPVRVVELACDRYEFEPDDEGST